MTTTGENFTMTTRREKSFVLQIAYPDLRKALIERGWREETDKSYNNYDLKFTLNAQDIPFNLL